MAEKKKTRWMRVRKFFNDIHLWAGLISGLVVIAICFSGTVYVFNTEIREMASPELYHVTPQTNAALTPDEIIAKVSQATGGKVVSIKTYEDPSRSWQVSVRKKEDRKPEGASGREKKTAPLDNITAKEVKGKGAPQGTGGPGGNDSRPDVYLVDPYTGELKGSASEKNNVTEFMSTMFSLHRWLLLDKIEEPIFGELPNRKLGSYISGTCTILFTLGLITGLVIWFPQKIKSWKQGLTVKWDSNWKRINHDLHNSLAFYSFIFLLLMGITGPQWSFPWYREGLQKSLGTYQSQDAPRPEMPKSSIPVFFDGKDFIPLKVTDYLAAADKLLPYKGNCTVTFASDSAAAIGISKSRIGFFAPAAGDKIFLDQYTAEVLSIDIFRDKPFNQRVASSIKALHLGDVYGTFTKILYFIACLIATTLPVTGTIIWINKLRKKRRNRHKKETLFTEKSIEKVVITQ